ncbi:hypothetical protein BDP27DRAFT_1420048 [Rhodocollybia butyracea]|uniref:Uncharacterized protein n=1 Tax=Rhodocollybia butyracea TaxID=206335 RepID=A0A9P5PW27_9AGAR|nr:hypothetical protein BDP27DRAFT_1420048 [Rhodocollybia butyracea]
MASESFRSISCSISGWSLEVNLAVPGTLSIICPENADMEESVCDIPITIAKSLDINDIDTTGPPVCVDLDPSPEELEAQYRTVGIKVRDYAYAGRVVSPVVPQTAVSANSRQAHEFASARIDPITRTAIPPEEVVHPLPPVPEIFDPYWALALHDLIIHERRVENDRNAEIEKSKFLSSVDLPIQPSQVPIPGKILHRLLNVTRWLTEQDTKKWLEEDWLSLEAYLDSGAEALQPCLIRRIPERNLPSWEEQQAWITEALESAWVECPPTPRTQAAQVQFLATINQDVGPPAATRGGNWVHADGRYYNPSECVRIIAHRMGPTTCEPVEATPRTIYAEGITGEYADGVGDLVPAREDRIKIFESRKGSVIWFWNCLRKSQAAKLGLGVLPWPPEKLGETTKRLVEIKPAPRFKRGLEDEDGSRDGPQAKKSRLDPACH